MKKKTIYSKLFQERRAEIPMAGKIISLSKMKKRRMINSKDSWMKIKIRMKSIMSKLMICSNISVMEKIKIENHLGKMNSKNMIHPILNLFLSMTWWSWKIKRKKRVHTSEKSNPLLLLNSKIKPLKLLISIHISIGKSILSKMKKLTIC